MKVCAVCRWGWNPIKAQRRKRTGSSCDLKLFFGLDSSWSVSRIHYVINQCIQKVIRPLLYAYIIYFPPQSLNNPWKQSEKKNVSTAWLESTCSKSIGWLDMIWKGTHLSLLRSHSWPRRAKTKLWGQSNSLQSSETGLCRGTGLRKATKTFLLHKRFPRTRWPP